MNLFLHYLNQPYQISLLPTSQKYTLRVVPYSQTGCPTCPWPGFPKANQLMLWFKPAGKPNLKWCVLVLLDLQPTNWFVWSYLKNWIDCNVSLVHWNNNFGSLQHQAYTKRCADCTIWFNKCLPWFATGVKVPFLQVFQSAAHGLLPVKGTVFYIRREK